MNLTPSGITSCYSNCVCSSCDIPQILQPLSIIGVFVGVGVDTVTLSHILNPRPWQSEEAVVRVLLTETNIRASADFKNILRTV